MAEEMSKVNKAFREFVRELQKLEDWRKEQEIIDDFERAVREKDLGMWRKERHKKLEEEVI